jgi:hypothetical protein
MSWSKPDPKCYGTARPLRVAYLVDVTTTNDQLLDAIFAESYGRWGGRRSEAAILQALAERRPLLTLASLSEALTPYLEMAERTASWRSGLSLVIGDSVEDRLLFCARSGRT